MKKLTNPKSPPPMTQEEAMSRMAGQPSDNKGRPLPSMGKFAAASKEMQTNPNAGTGTLSGKPLSSYAAWNTPDIQHYENSASKFMRPAKKTK